MSSIAYNVAARLAMPPSADVLNFGDIMALVLKIMALAILIGAVVIIFNSRKSKWSEVGTHGGMIFFGLLLAGFAVACIANPNIIGVVGGAIAHAVLVFSG